MFRTFLLLATVLATVISMPACTAARTRVTATADVSIAMSFLEALGRVDFDAAASLLDEQAVLELPYVNDGLVVRSKVNVLQFLRQSMSKSVGGIAYKLDQAYPSPDAGATVLELTTQGRTAAGR